MAEMVGPWWMNKSRNLVSIWCPHVEKVGAVSSFAEATRGRNDGRWGRHKGQARVRGRRNFELQAPDIFTRDIRSCDQDDRYGDVQYCHGLDIT